MQAGNALAHMRMCKLGHESAGAISSLKFSSSNMYYIVYIKKWN